MQEAEQLTDQMPPRAANRSDRTSRSPLSPLRTVGSPDGAGVPPGAGVPGLGVPGPGVPGLGVPGAVVPGLGAGAVLTLPA